MANAEHHSQSGMHQRDADRDFGAATADKAKETASNVVDRAKDMASSAAQSARDLASNAQRKADDALSSVGGGMQSAAGRIREKGPQEGFLGTASSRVAETLEGGGRYLQEEGISGVAEDLTNVIRRNPIAALFVGIGIGFLLARATSSRS
jgi:hypothetical protein